MSRVLGTEKVLAATGTTAAMDDGDVVECTDDDLQVADVAGYEMGIFELDTAAGGWSAAPTEFAVFNLYEQKINSDGNDAPDVHASNHPFDLIGQFVPKIVDEQQYLSIEAPIHHYGAKYWLEWLDGGSGTAQLAAGWALRVIPFSYKAAT